MVQQLRSKVHRWHQLSRYYLNKWQYDGSKWAERVWYGERNNSASSIASVPFMITRNMRQQLERAGFPGQEISVLLPKDAHELIANNTTYAQYLVLKEQQKKEMEALAAAAKESIEREEKGKKQIITVTDELLVVVEAKNADDVSQEETIATTQTQVVIVDVPEDKKKEDNM